MAITRLARVFMALFRASSEYSSSIFEGVLFRALKTIPPSSIEAERAISTCGLFATRVRSRLNDDTLNALLITNKFYKKEKLLENEKDLAKQKLSSKPAKAAETTETVEAAVQKSLTQN